MKHLFFSLSAILVLSALLVECVTYDIPCIIATLIGSMGIFRTPKRYRLHVAILAIFIVLLAVQLYLNSVIFPLFLPALALIFGLSILPQSRFFTAAAMLGGLYLLSNTAYIQLPGHSGQTAFLQRGGWGVSLPHDRSICIASQYSYDVLKKFLRSHDITTPLQLNESDSDFWIITPTHPISEQESQHILEWVNNGGRLYVVTDHTNLFGHRDALSELWKRTGIDCRDDVVINQSDESFYLGKAGFYEGLSANTIAGKGEPFLIQWGYRERPDYMGRCFFSDNQVSDEDEWGVYAVGLTTKYGKGCIVTMADSTLFANFALAFPSAQSILEETLNAKPFPFRLAAGLIFTFLPLWKKRPVCFAIPVIIFAVLFTCRKTECLHPDMPTLSLATTDISYRGEFASILATAYEASDMFPLWEKDGKRALKPLPMEKNDEDWMDAIFSHSSPSKQNLLEAALSDAKNRNIWFDTGIGWLREYAARHYWQSICKGTDKTLGWQVESSSHAAELVQSGEVVAKGDCIISTIQDCPEWVIIGEKVIGRMVDSHTILLKKEWQLPMTHCEDSILIINR